MNTNIAVAVIGGLATIAAAIIAGMFASRKGKKDSTTADLSSNPSKTENHRSLACRVISETMAMLFVDLMRLLYVASSDIARKANAGRHVEFIDFADLHLRNLESHISSRSVSLGADLAKDCCDLERQLSYMVNELKVEKDLTEEHTEYFAKMRKIGAELHKFCLAALSESYERTFKRVGAELDRVVTQNRWAIKSEALDEIWRLRLTTQSELLKASRELEEADLETIKDDMKHQAAITYFILDYKILREITAA